MRSTPLVAAVLHANAEDKNYQLYCAAYGLEMQIDNEWDAEAVLLAPHEHLHAVTEDTGVTGEDTAIVSAGVTDIPVQRGGKPDVSAIKGGRNNWLLVAGPGNADTEETIKEKLHAALDAGCPGHSLLFRDRDEPIALTVGGHRRGRAPPPRHCLCRTRCRLAAGGKEGCAICARPPRINDRAVDGPRFIVGGTVTAEVATALTAIKGVSGVLLLEDKYGHFGDILEILAALGGPHKD